MSARRAVVVVTGIALTIAFTSPAIAEDVLAAAAAEGLNCDECPNVVEPVCAQMANGLSVTLAHRCFAICQSLANIRSGNCEDSFNAALLEEHAVAAAAGGNQAPPMLVQRRRFQAPSATKKCQPTLKQMTKFAAEGAVFVGCAAVSAKPGPEPPSEASAATADGPVVSAAAAIASAPADNAVVMTAHIVDTKTRHLFIKAHKTTAQEAVAAAAAAATKLPTTTGTKKAPSPEEWAKAQTRRVTRSPRRLPVNNPDTANQTEAGTASKVSFDSEPMGPAGGNRRLLQMPDNRWGVSPTTNWPWPAMSAIFYRANVGGFVCSGTIISPDDVLTAAHCVVDSATGEVFRDYSIVPGADGDKGSVQPYGRYGSSSLTYWSWWVGAGWNANQGIAAGSIYGDVALINLDRPITWWQAMGYACSWRNYNIRTCGYPGDRNLWPHCADGTSWGPMDFCDATRDHLGSNNAKISKGQSGGPVYNSDNGLLMAVNSGLSPDDSRFAPLDNYNWQLLMDPAWRNTIWSITDAFRVSPGAIRTVMNNKCLDADSFNLNQRVVMRDCAMGRESQRWVRPGPGDRRLRVGEPWRNRCLEILGGYVSKHNGAAVVLWECNGNDSQVWLADRMGRLRPQHAPNKCLDIGGSNGSNGAQLVIWDCHSGSNQRWIV